MGDVTNLPNPEPKPSQSGRQPEGDQPAYHGDMAIYRMVVFFLGVVVIAATVGALICEMSPKTHEIPQFLIALGSGALGGLCGLLVPSPVSTSR